MGIIYRQCIDQPFVAQMATDAKEDYYNMILFE